MAVVEGDLDKLETRLEKQFREETEKLVRDLTKRHEAAMAGIEWLEKNSVVRLDALDKQSMQFKEINAHRTKMDQELRNLELEQRKTVKAMEEAQDKARADTLKGIGSTELAVKKLEREVELLTKDLASLKKEALVGADMKALTDRIKKLEAAK